MSYTVLARKYRPQRFSDVIGQEHVTRTLKNALEQQRIAHGYIFSGHRGIGKTTIARILAMALNCQSADHPVAEPCGACDSCREIRDGSVGAMDVIEIDAATNRGIEEVRGLIATATAEPARDRFRIFILDEAHQVTDAAFNALLKTLEEPPPWVVFMMATTQPEDIPQTIRSRCQHFSFHAVNFQDIVGQLHSIAGQEQLTIEDDAIALLAEAGDGSMRDALSIMDQAIACCGTTLTADVVRGLIGTVSSDVLENVLQAVHDNSSEGVIRAVDKLLVEGHSPVHFARQLVRFLRNAIIAKVAGGDSSLLQISSDERNRVLRIAEYFTEEDLTRFLQIMLRTHGEVSYKQEQRFHLELGLLKMVHAQRLLPLEQLLSDAAAGMTTTAATSAVRGSATASRPQAAPAPRPAAPVSRQPADAASPFGEQRPSRPSPFEADRARKSNTPKSEVSVAVGDPIAPKSASTDSSLPGSITPVSVTPASILSNSRSSAAVAVAAEPILASPVAVTGVEQIPEVADSAPLGEVSIEKVRDSVLNVLEAAGQRMLALSLEEGEWSVDGSEVVVNVAMSQKLVDMALGVEQKKQVNQAATSAGGRWLKVRINGGAKPVVASNPKRTSMAGGSAARGRAADEPIVKRMMEKFGAEVRTVIDKQK
jgi:DNA polymerase III subunit gamma/tau